MPDNTPVQGVPLEVPAEKSGSFLRWPSPKALITWLALGGAVLTAGGFVFLRTGIYELDKQAQAQVNATVHEAQSTVTVRLDAIQRQVEIQIADSKDQRAEQKADMKVLQDSVNTLVRRSH